MAGFYGSSTELTYGTKFPNEVRMEVAMDKVIHMINPSRNPFLVLANVVGKLQVPQPRFDWMEDENFISRHFTAILEVGTDTAAYDHPAGFRLTDPRDWQAIEAMTNESGYTGARDVFIEIRFDADSAVVGYLKKSAIVEGKTLARAFVKSASGGAKTASATTTEFAHMIQITADVDAPNDADNDVDMEVISATWPGDMVDGVTVQCRVYTPNFVQSSSAYGFGSGGFKEGSGTIPDTRKTVANYHNFVQIFKTSLQVTGTMMANRALYGGPERARLRAKKAMQHASDIEWAVMFNGGGTENTDWGIMDTSENPRRVFKGLGVGTTTLGSSGWIATWNGGHNSDMQLSYAAGEYDDVVAITEKLFDDTDAGSETKIVYASKKWLTKFSELFYRDNSGIAENVVYTNMGDILKKAGIRVKSITTAHGDLVLSSHPFLRGPYEDYAVILDPKNVQIAAYRDTVLRTNIQTPDLDGVMDEYLTEVGLKVMHEHTHAILKLTA